MQRLLMVGMNHATAPLAVREKCRLFRRAARSRPGEFRERVSQKPRRSWSPPATAWSCTPPGRCMAIRGRRRWSVPRRVPRDRRGGAAPAPLRRGRPRGGRAPVHRGQFAGLAGGGRDADPRADPRGVRGLARSGTAGALLHPLFQRAIAAAREVMTRDAPGRGPAIRRLDRRGVRPADLRELRATRRC